MIAENDPITKVVAGHYCKNPQCPVPMESSGAEPTQEFATKSCPAALSMDEFVVSETSKLLKIEQIVLASVDAQTKQNGQKIGMFVKEIYRSWRNSQ